MNKKLVSSYLEKISKIDLELIGNIKISNDSTQVINTAIFKKDFFKKFNRNIDKYKIHFFLILGEKENKLLRVKLDVEIDFEDNNLTSFGRDLLYSEINVNLSKINFLKETYDIEASKVDPTYIYTPKNIHYNYYNRTLFGISKIQIEKKFNSEYCPSFSQEISKKNLQNIIKYSQKINPNIRFKFGKYNNFFFSNGEIKITNKETYNIQNIISIFFHEVTHYFRHKNALNNFGFAHTFSDYASLEEGIALFNEYKYGNIITNYGNYIPYYDYCYNILNSDYQEEEKIDKIYEILKCKGYSKQKSLNYYYRFFRYSTLGGKNFFLKDLIYANSYRNVQKLISEDKSNYDIIMSGQIGLNEITQKHFITKNNEQSKEYFKKMTKKIVSINKGKCLKF